MVPAPPAIPTRFPCWCRAVYSYGGEVRRGRPVLHPPQTALLTRPKPAVETRSGFHRRRPDRMPQCWRRLVVDRSLATGPEGRWSLPLQLRRGPTRRFPPREPLHEPHAAGEQHASAEPSRKVKDFSKALRGLRQGPTLHHGKTARDVQTEPPRREPPRCESRQVERALHDANLLRPEPQPQRPRGHWKDTDSAGPRGRRKDTHPATPR